MIATRQHDGTHESAETIRRWIDEVDPLPVQLTWAGAGVFAMQIGTVGRLNPGWTLHRAGNEWRILAG